MEFLRLLWGLVPRFLDRARVKTAALENLSNPARREFRYRFKATNIGYRATSIDRVEMRAQDYFGNVKKMDFTVEEPADSMLPSQTPLRVVVRAEDDFKTYGPRCLSIYFNAGKSEHIYLADAHGAIALTRLSFWRESRRRRKEMREKARKANIPSK